MTLTMCGYLCIRLNRALQSRDDHRYAIYRMNRMATAPQTSSNHVQQRPLITSTPYTSQPPSPELVASTPSSVELPILVLDGDDENHKQHPSSKKKHGAASPPSSAPSTAPPTPTLPPTLESSDGMSSLTI
jgi:hypothetical protein